MIKSLATLVVLFFSNVIASQNTVQIPLKNNSYTLKCYINGIPMDFTFDTGATSVSISLTEADFLMKHGYLKKTDFLNSTNIQIANGDVIQGSKIILRKVQIGEIILENIEATVIHNLNAPLLLGMSAINKIGKVVIENKVLYIYPHKSNLVLTSAKKNSSSSRTAESYIEVYKIGNLEVMKEDLMVHLDVENKYYMNWETALNACNSLGDGWRLPTVTELKLIYKNKKLIGGFDRVNWTTYWSSEKTGIEDYVWRYDFETGKQVYDSKINFANVRAVRSR